MGIDEIPLDLLQHQEQHNKPKRLDGIHHKDQKGSDGTSDESPKDRDQRREGDDHAHQQRVGHLEERHGNDKHGSQYDGLQTLPCKKAGKSAVGQ